MDNLYFINGILSTIIVYAGFYAIRTQKQYKAVLHQLDAMKSQNTLLHARSNENLETYVSSTTDLKESVEKVTTQMKEDSYTDITEVNKKLEALESKVGKIQQDLFFTSGNVEKNNSTLFSEIQQLKHNIKALGADPNLLNRY